MNVRYQKTCVYKSVWVADQNASSNKQDNQYKKWAKRNTYSLCFRSAKTFWMNAHITLGNTTLVELGLTAVINWFLGDESKTDLSFANLKIWKY